MSLTLHLGPDDDFPSDTEHCGKSFFDEIISATYPDYFRHDNFLSEEEQILFFPDYDKFDNSLDHYRRIDPIRLMEVFKKVLEHLKSHHAQYPLVHMIYVDKINMIGGSISDDFQYKGYTCHLDGYHNDYNHRQEIRVRRLNNGWETFELIKADPIITLDGKTFYIETENKYEQYKGILEELIDICEQAIKTNKKLLWIFSN